MKVIVKLIKHDVNIKYRFGVHLFLLAGRNVQLGLSLADMVITKFAVVRVIIWVIVKYFPAIRIFAKPYFNMVSATMPIKRKYFAMTHIVTHTKMRGSRVLDILIS